MNTVYYGIGSLTELGNYLLDLSVWSLPILPGPPVIDPNAVITSLAIDAPSNVFATSGIQTDLMQEFELVSGSLPLGGLQAGISSAASQGRVVTAIGFRDYTVVYLAYGWERDTSVYQAKVAVASFGTVATEAASLAEQGYIITALGGSLTDGFLLVGTRVAGQPRPRPIRIVTDSVRSQPYQHPATTLGREGYAIVGGILGRHGSTSPLFSMYIGQK